MILGAVKVWAHVAPQSWFLNTKRKHGCLEKCPDFRARAENVQNEPGTFYCVREEISKVLCMGWRHKTHFWRVLTGQIYHLHYQNNDSKLTYWTRTHDLHIDRKMRRGSTKLIKDEWYIREGTSLTGKPKSAELNLYKTWIFKIRCSMSVFWTVWKSYCCSHWVTEDGGTTLGKTAQ